MTTDDLVPFVKAIESMFASVRNYNRDADTVFEVRKFMNGEFRREGELPPEWSADVDTKTIKAIREMYPDHANMCLMWRIMPEVRRWEANEYGPGGCILYLRLRGEYPGQYDNMRSAA